jgi:hypothetical protein
MSDLPNNQAAIDDLLAASAPARAALDTLTAAAQRGYSDLLEANAELLKPPTLPACDLEEVRKAVRANIRSVVLDVLEEIAAGDSTDARIVALHEPR